MDHFVKPADYFPKKRRPIIRNPELETWIEMSFQADHGLTWTEKSQPRIKFIVRLYRPSKQAV